MVRLGRSIGTLLVGTGLLHIALGLAGGAKPLAGIRRDGVTNAVDPHPERQAWVWYMFTGWLLVALGQVVRWGQRRDGVLPAALGWHLTAIGAVGAILMPLSGFWLILAQGVLALRTARRPVPVASRRSRAR